MAVGFGGLAATTLFLLLPRPLALDTNFWFLLALDCLVILLCTGGMLMSDQKVRKGGGLTSAWELVILLILQLSFRNL